MKLNIDYRNLNELSNIFMQRTSSWFKILINKLSILQRGHIIIQY
jgi:hypothetical protein